MSKRFIPVRGPEDKLNSMGFNDGYVYFCTDTGHIYTDYYEGGEVGGAKVERQLLGGSGGGGEGGNAKIYYANRELTDDEKLEDEIVFPLDTIEGGEYPDKDGLMFNSGDSSFYRVLKISRVDKTATCQRLTVAGGGGGGGGDAGSLAEDINLKVESLEVPVLINGQSQKVYFTAYSAKSKKGESIDDKITINWTLAYTEDSGASYTTYKTGIITVNDGERSSLEFGTYAKNSATSKLTLRATQANHNSEISRSVDFSTSKLELQLASDFSKISVYDDTLTLRCNVYGDMDKILEYYYDDDTTPVKTVLLNASSSASQTLKVIDALKSSTQEIKTITNGYHKVWIRLYQNISSDPINNPIKGAEVEPQVFELGVWDQVDSSEPPIIWLGDYKTEYYSYDTIQIPFRVFDPASPEKTTVHFKRNGIELSYSPQEIDDFRDFAIFEIANPELDVLNHYTISCGEGEREVTRKIEFRVVKDPNREDFGIQKSALLTYELNTVGSGRSNSESLSRRMTLTNAADDKNPCPAVFENFNWYNNGWIQDADHKTCLRISNGAKLTIPIGPMVFADTSADINKSHSIEFMFKIRNVQDYSTLIRTITRYKNDTDLYNAFYDSEKGSYKTNYTNYDAFLAWYLKNNYVPFIDGAETRAMTYDDLVFSNISKQINLDNVACGYYSGTSASTVGLCLGPQDAFFSNGTDTVNVSYVENQIVTLTAVYKYDQVATQNLLFIYLNGVLTGVTKNTLSSPFKIDSDAIVFDSEHCDIDLYKIRVYRTALTVNDIVMNYAADFENVGIYDQNKLAEENRVINEYQFNYHNMIKYNENHPDEPLMPYIVFDTSDTNDDKLPYSKKVKINCSVEFVNTTLDSYYSKGKLEELAKADGLWSDGSSAEEKAAAIKKYYQYHCPSFYSDNSEMSVQGTSSEFYPRRNYKIKTKQKNSDGEKRINIFLNRGPFKEEYDADKLGMTQKPYKLATSPYLDTKLTYYKDANGEQPMTFDESNPYEKNKYYIKNTAYVAPGDESTRQGSGWYFNNYTCPTDKWTMKIDFMESSGTYNMGFANMVNSAYSKHPLDDYNKAKAFEIEDASTTVQVEATKYEEGVVYSYYNHKGNLKNTQDDELNILSSAEDFALGPRGLAIKNGISKVLGGIENEVVYSDDAKGKFNAEQLAEITNKWYKQSIGYKNFEIDRTEDYRTSVRGFRTLAFHKKKNPNGGDPIYQFIGMYNMLLDKGSDECYGFDLEGTTGKTVRGKFVNNKDMSKVAECWEFQNNSRTYCSYRDPRDRKDLRFDVFDDNGNRLLNAVKSAPLSADSFEYRYHDDEDALDYIVNPDGKFEDDSSLDFDINDITANQENRVNRFLEDSKNWEKAVAWVWSTCTEKVVSNGIYKTIDIGDEVFNPATHYEYGLNPDYDEEVSGSEQFIYLPASEYVPGNTYYKQQVDEKGEITYVVAYIGEYLFSDKKNELYVGTENNSGEISYAPVGASDVFDSSNAYYILENYSDEELDLVADRLVELCTAEEFDPTQTYYTYDGDKKCGEAVNKITLTNETYEPNKYYIGKTVTYGSRFYKYDTQEYRGDKFINELADHFDPEYMATYFVMTEVFECYDSRGKNCMMATWGPLKEGGDYIWYPIFYDIDTQLGINNTGIPSFEYNVDATEDGNYSTSDSVLWNNFYKYCKTAYIIPKYKHLRGSDTNVFGSALELPPLKNVDRIEKWYLTNYEVTKNLADLGVRPLVATNLDEYYKYITITNSASYQDGTTGHISSDTEGKYTYDTSGGYFYALQGDRSLSRQQFLANRIEYIDSWLNEGNYQRGGENRIRGRVSANNPSRISDEWVENVSAGEYYYKDNDEAAGVKNHLFDAEYWMTLTPAHSSYVTLGDDNEAYPSRKYDGINPLKFTIDSIESGVRTSPNYPEQLLYVYGINQMQDLGDMSNLYWQEFAITGDASKLTSLKLGYDGLDESGKSWYNRNVNQFTIPASSEDAIGMPLLKEVNMSNIQLSDSAGSYVLDLTSCEKLQNFRNTGSNFTSIKFAKGVALDTLYLTSNTDNIELTEVNLLKNLITEDEYEVPVRNEEGNLIAKPGLYIQGLFGKDGGIGTTKINNLSIQGSGLGYDSYKLLKQYYDLRKLQSNPSDITMTKVQWSPYTQVGDDESYVPEDSKLYYVDDGHYGLEPYVYTTAEAWEVRTENGEIFKKEAVDEAKVNQITDLAMFKEFIDDSKFRKNTTTAIPEITGIIYVNNTAEIDESELRNKYSAAFPELKIFCANVKKGYTARFVVMDDEEGNDGRYTLIGSMTLASGETWFKNPIDVYGDVSKYKSNHDFYGWALTNSASADIIVNIDKSINTWNSQSIVPNQYTYTFYAICPIHKWDVKYCYKDGTLIELIPTPHNTYAQMTTDIPWKDDSALPLEETYQFLGYTRSVGSNSLVNLEEYLVTENTTFYAVFNENPVSVYDNIHPEYFAPSTIKTERFYTGEQYNIIGDDLSYNLESAIALSLQKKVKGKLVVPATYTVNGVTYPVYAIDATFGSPGDDTQNQASYHQRNDEGKWGPDLGEAIKICDKCYGENLTHVFFEKNSDGTANIREICKHAFSGDFNLVWVEFPTGLRYIRDYAFYMPDKMGTTDTQFPKFRNVNIGGSIKYIGANAFDFTFAHEADVNTLIIGSNVTTCGLRAFGLGGRTFLFTAGNDYPFGIRTVIIGGENGNKSKLGLRGNMTGKGVVFYGWGESANNTVEWHTDFPAGTNDDFFANFTPPINHIS